MGFFTDIVAANRAKGLSQLLQTIRATYRAVFLDHIAKNQNGESDGHHTALDRVLIAFQIDVVNQVLSQHTYVQENDRVLFKGFLINTMTNHDSSQRNEFDEVIHNLRTISEIAGDTNTQNLKRATVLCEKAGADFGPDTLLYVTDDLIRFSLETHMAIAKTFGDKPGFLSLEYRLVAMPVRLALQKKNG